MLAHCPKSCNSCRQISPPLLSTAEEEKETATAEATSNNSNNKEEDRENVLFSLLAQSKSFGVLQKVDGGSGSEAKIVKRLESTIKYMASEKVQQLPINIKGECKNRHELCIFWVTLGECERNAAYMRTACAPACESCHLIDERTRCPKLEDMEAALESGGLNQMFQRIVNSAPGNNTNQQITTENDYSQTPQYTVHVHSRPSSVPVTDVSIVQDKSLPPWVVSFDHFLTDEECDALIQLGYKYEYKQSEDVGKIKFDGSFDSRKSSRRTSENSWCSEKSGCRQEEVPIRIHDRMSQVMGIPPHNSEDLQLLKYEVGQFYKTHHDFISHQREKQCGPRILTFFLYLSDVEQGGGTNFPTLGITVTPKKGRALLWPSVLDSDPTATDVRMKHQALPVEEGTKFAANGWIHLYDHLGPQRRGCN